MLLLHAILFFPIIIASPVSVENSLPLGSRRIALLISFGRGKLGFNMLGYHFCGGPGGFLTGNPADGGFSAEFSTPSGFKLRMGYPAWEDDIGGDDEQPKLRDNCESKYLEKTVHFLHTLKKNIHVPTTIEKTVRAPSARTIMEKTVEVPSQVRVRGRFNGEVKTSQKVAVV
ncbi:hypothetical protein BDFB_008254 [Asbolus verrucosus]|uniref:Uncharacterized protein n=1 Tax=Asbolus verrucosus TaxID=1661398 RepID=A0A482VNK2_ASBVE|nr:hypothetical protein BDFB_008254 [Asbolus verrucosus]